MMETLKDLQLEHMIVPIVQAFPTLVVPTLAAVAFYGPVALWAPALPTPVLATTMDVPEPAARLLWSPLGEIAWNNTWSSGRNLT